MAEDTDLVCAYVCRLLKRMRHTTCAILVLIKPRPSCGQPVPKWQNVHGFETFLRVVYSP